ncbi:MAG: hypothetical protein RL653_491 [Pseudomonadota bacterium]|jgi:STE24 endopeptidase
MLEVPFTAAELAEIRAYQFPRQAWFVLSTPVDVALSAAWLAWVVRPLYDAAARHADWLERRLMATPPGGLRAAATTSMRLLWRGPGWGTALLFALYDLLLYSLLFVPLELYLGFFHERAFGLSTHTPGSFAWDLLKGTLARALFNSLLVFGLFGLARRTPRWWLLLGVPSAVLLLGAAVLDPYRSRLYFESEPLSPGPARAAVESTLARAGVEHAEVMVEHTGRVTRKLQAYFAGQGPTRRVVLNDALLEHLGPDELAAAVAHEAGHIHESKWPARILSAVALVGFLWLVSRMQHWAAKRGAWGIREPADVRTLPAATTLFLLITSVAGPVTAWVGRRGELAADHYALEVTKAPDAFSSMLVKAARVNKMDPAPPRLLVWAGHSHPPIADRLAAVEDWKTAAAGRRAPVPTTP